MLLILKCTTPPAIHCSYTWPWPNIFIRQCVPTSALFLEWFQHIPEESVHFMPTRHLGRLIVCRTARHAAGVAQLTAGKAGCDLRCGTPMYRFVVAVQAENCFTATTKQVNPANSDHEKQLAL